MSYKCLKYNTICRTIFLAALMVLGAGMAHVASAQVPVDEDGNPIGAIDERTADSAAYDDESLPRLSQAELQELVGPVALYPDDLLAIVLPASTYPLQVVEAQRFLDARANDPSLEPDENWDDSVVALLNYPEVVELLNEDLDWTWQLGEAVIAQQTDVLTAVRSFRDRAYAAGNLESDDYQTVARNDGVIEIEPVSEDVIYVPYYEPEHVVIRQPRRVYYYYPDPCPVYYYPYASNYAFSRGYFWGLTTAFSIGWYTDSLHVFHHSYRGHPYYSRYYAPRWWYRRPSISQYYSHYYAPRYNDIRITINRYESGDRWRRGDAPRFRHSDRQVVRSRGYASSHDGRRSLTRQVSQRRDHDGVTRYDSHRERSGDRVSSVERRSPAVSTPPRQSHERSRSRTGSVERRSPAISTPPRQSHERSHSRTGSVGRRSPAVSTPPRQSHGRTDRQRGHERSRSHSGDVGGDVGRRSPAVSTPPRQSHGRTDRQRSRERSRSHDTTTARRSPTHSSPPRRSESHGPARSQPRSQSRGESRRESHSAPVAEQRRESGQRESRGERRSSGDRRRSRH